MKRCGGGEKTDCEGCGTRRTRAGADFDVSWAATKGKTVSSSCRVLGVRLGDKILPFTF